jgi:flagellin
MSLVVNTNIGSLNAQRSLASSSNELATAMERLSSGKKINSAADDAAGFAIAERMTAQVRGLNMATKNANDGLSMLAVIENATNDVTDMLQRMRELAVQAANDTNSATDRGYLQKEADALLAEINRVASQTKYNGQTVLDGTYQNKAIQVGTDAGQTVSFSVAGIDTGTLGLQTNAVFTQTHGTLSNYASDTHTLTDGTTTLSITQGSSTPTTTELVTLFQSSAGYDDFKYDVAANGNTGFTFTAKQPGVIQTAEQPVLSAAAAVSDEGTLTITVSGSSNIDLVNDASSALASISSAIEKVSGQRAEYGALQNRLEYTVSNLMNVSEFTTAARSRIEDADFAAESARLAKAQVLQQTGTAMLAQANASSQLAISLIR